MTEFQFKKNVKVVVNFDIGETVLIEGWGKKLDGKRVISEFKENYGGSQSGVVAKVIGYEGWLDIGWFTKIIRECD